MKSELKVLTMKCELKVFKMKSEFKIFTKKHEFKVFKMKCNGAALEYHFYSLERLLVIKEKDE